MKVMFSYILKSIFVLSVIIAILAMGVTYAYARPVCKQKYHVVDAKRSINKIYAGKRHVTRIESGRLDRMVRCQHSKGASRYVDWFRGKRASEWRLRRNFTGYQVSGYTSSFGYPADGDGITADGGNTMRPCIAMWQGQLGSIWLLTVLGRSTKVILCDRGPASWTGKTIDITGIALWRLGLSPYNYGNHYGTVRELRHW